MNVGNILYVGGAFAAFGALAFLRCACRRHEHVEYRGTEPPSHVRIIEKEDQ